MTPTPTSTTTSTRPPKRMCLANVVKGRIDRPPHIVVYGTDGVGKSTFGADAPDPIFLGAEDGTAHMAHVPRFPQPFTWDEVFDALRELLETEHGYKTLVVDSLDWLEPIVWSHVCKKHRASSIEQIGGGWGKGYTEALTEWRSVLARLELLRAKKRMQIILIAHSMVKMTKHPDQEDYERYQLALNQKAADVIRQWADVVLFARDKTYTTTQNNRQKGVSSGSRIVHTERRAAWDAKNRYGLKPELPLNYGAVMTAIAEGVSAEEQRARVAALLEVVDDGALVAKVRKAVAECGNDGTKLAKLAELVNARINLSARKEEEDAA